MPQKKISIRIDGELVNAAEGQTILEAARASNKYDSDAVLPRGSDAVGACRLCMVEVSGIDRLFPACTTPVQDGMSVITNSARLTQYRRMRVELLSGGAQSRLRGMRLQWSLRAAVHGARDGHHQRALRLQLSRSLSVDMSHPRFVLDHNRCILCTRCVRVCAEVEGAHVWEVVARGIHARIVQRPEPEVGRRENLHQLWQVRPGLPDGRAGRKGQGGGRDGQAPRQGSPRWPGTEECGYEESQGWLRCGWTAARAATCRCSIWTEP